MIFANLNKKIELAANVSIIAVAALLCLVLVKNHLLNRPAMSVNAASAQPTQTAIGMNLSSFDVDWTQSRQTLVLAISSGCHFCTESAPFYKTVVNSKKDTRLVAILPQPVEEGKNYLETLGVAVDEVRQMPLDKLGVHGTPTLLLVDSVGSVKDSWVGKLPPEREAGVLKRLQL